MKEEQQNRENALYVCNGEVEECSKSNCYKTGGDCMLTHNIMYAETNNLRKFDVVRRITDVKKFSELIFDILKEKESAQEIEKFLTEEFPNDGLQKLESKTLIRISK